MANCKFCGKLCKYREAYEGDEDALIAEHCDSCVMNRLLDLGV